MNDPLELGQFAAVLSGTPWRSPFRRGPDGRCRSRSRARGSGACSDSNHRRSAGTLRLLLAGVLPGETSRARARRARALGAGAPRGARSSATGAPTAGGVGRGERAALARDPDGPWCGGASASTITRRHRDEAAARSPRPARAARRAGARRIAMFDRDPHPPPRAGAGSSSSARPRRPHRPPATTTSPRRAPSAGRRRTGAGSGPAERDRGRPLEFADGIPPVVPLGAAPLVRRGRAVGGITILTEDVTRRKEAEEAIAPPASGATATSSRLARRDLRQPRRAHRLRQRRRGRLFAAPSPTPSLGRPVLDVIHPDSHATVRARIAALEAGRPIPEMRVHRRSTGSARGRGRRRPLVDREGPAIQVVMRDIGERLRAAQAALPRGGALPAAREAIREVFWMTDVEKQQILYISPGYETIWAAPRQPCYATPTAWMDAGAPRRPRPGPLRRAHPAGRRRLRPPVSRRAPRREHPGVPTGPSCK